MSETNLSLMARLINLQSDLPVVKKGMSNPYFNSKYADINSYLEVVMPLLSKYRVVLLQPLTTLEDGTPAVQTILTCETGERIESICPLAKLSDPQKLGAYITYVRRYSLQSILAMSAEDDDAESFYDRPARPVAPAGAARRTWATKKWE